MNQIEATSKLYDCLCRSCAPKAEEILTAAIEQALAVQPEKRPQNCGTGFCSCIECPYSDHFPEAGKMMEPKE